MKYDGLLLFSDSQAITATTTSTNGLDWGTITRQMGIGNSLYVVTVVTVAMTDAGSNSTITVALGTDDNAAFSSETTGVQTLYVIPAVQAIGAQFIARLQPITTPEEFCRLTYTTTNGDLTTGSFTSFITDNVQAWTAYPKGFTVSSAEQFS